MTSTSTNVSAIDTARSYTVKELSTLLGYTQTSLRDLIRAGKIQGVKPMGGHIRILGTEVKRLVDGVSSGTGISATAGDDDVDEIEVTHAQAAKAMPGGASDPPEDNGGEDDDNGEGGAFRHLLGGK